MHWRSIIRDFKGLLAEYVHRTSLNKAAAALSHDKKTIKSWLDGIAEPSGPKPVADLIIHALRIGIVLTPFQAYESIYDFSRMLMPYETKIQQGPPDLSWLTSEQQPPSVKTEFYDLKLDTPLGIASSPLMADENWGKLTLDLKYGLSTFKSRGHGSRVSLNPPQIAFVLERPDLINYQPSDPPQVLVTFDREKINTSILDLVNSIGAPSENSAAEWQEKYERIKNHPRGRFVGVSVIAEGRNRKELIADFELAVQKARDVNPPFVELNLSCPNLANGIEICEQPSLVAEICETARRVLSGTSILIMIKLPHLSQRAMLKLLSRAGNLVHAVSFRNTLKVRPVHRHENGSMHAAFVGREVAGLSGPCTFQLTLKGVKELVYVREKLSQEFRIVAIGGVSSVEDIDELRAAGADLVQASTAPMFDPLLGWKTRFHLKRTEPRATVLPIVELRQPRDEIELDSQRNAINAFAEIQRRYPNRTIPIEVLCEKWNAWIEERPEASLSRPHRMPARTFEQWLREFAA